MTARKVLFPTDFSSTATRALPLAIECAERFDAELHMLHAIVLHESDPLLANKSFEETEKLLQGAQIRVVRTHRRGFSPAAVILKYAWDNKADLIVMGTHGRSAASQIFLGGVAEEVVREAPCPVFSVKREDEAKSLGEMARVLVPVDFSSTSTSAIDKAVQMLSPAATELHLLHVLEQPTMVAPDFGAMPLVPVEERAEALARLREMAADIQARTPSMKPEIHVSEGVPAREILCFAEKQGVDLIVMGTHGLTGIVRLLFGSVAEKVVRRAHCPVFTVGLLDGKATSSDGYHVAQQSRLGDGGRKGTSHRDSSG